MLSSRKVYLYAHFCSPTKSPTPFALRSSRPSFQVNIVAFSIPPSANKDSSDALHIHSFVYMSLPGEMRIKGTQKTL